MLRLISMFTVLITIFHLIEQYIFLIEINTRMVGIRLPLLCCTLRDLKKKSISFFQIFRNLNNRFITDINIVRRV